MRTIGIAAAGELLDFNARLGAEERARAQLEGTVALHNMLARRKVAYLADEVGMGKTLVAIGVMALLRHFQPGARILVISPRENIQDKWMREVRNFISSNVRFPDLRIKAPDGRPAVELVKCSTILDLLRETQRRPSGIFFARMTSFSLGMGDPAEEGGRKLREGLRQYLPWLGGGHLGGRNTGKAKFKARFAAGVCCGLPAFDLVVIDEGHNLKHGLPASAAARNHVLARVLGRPGVDEADNHDFPGYGPRAQRALLLSATPVEADYRQLWNQLDVLGLGEAFMELKDEEASETEKKDIARQFLIRRVTHLSSGGQTLTKNQYRREWRGGGVHLHDEPIPLDGIRQKLTLALVQKKVAEVIGNASMGSSFQIGMLASFESFRETAVRKASDTERANFDGDQTENADEREGVDVAGINRLARSHRKLFGRELPHPKMDALCSSLAGTWNSGRKALVFVRRIASVTDLKRKLDEGYDDWIQMLLARKLPDPVRPKISAIFDEYRDQRTERREQLRREAHQDRGIDGEDYEEEDDKGDRDTFFAWFFRGDGPKGVLSGAALVKRFRPGGSSYTTFFEDNHAARVLRCVPGEVRTRLALALGITGEALEEKLRPLAAARIISKAENIGRREWFDAMQGAAIELLSSTVNPFQDAARRTLHGRFQNQHGSGRWRGTMPSNASHWLETPTFFTELSRPERQDLRHRLWPEPEDKDEGICYTQRELRAELLSAAARLGHAVIDLYAMHIGRVGSIELRAQDDAAGDGERDLQAIHAYLDLLEVQRVTPPEERTWGAYDELEAISSHFDLILDVNAPEARDQPLAKARQIFGTLLGRQQPVGGMSGGVNKTLVKQFRMPGYPLVLICTDVLQEGEDLHTFCAEVHHYGIAWTPSAMEQRTGRIDRVRSLAERRITDEGRTSGATDRLQVHYPHLHGTVEAMQVRTVLERMNKFLLLMHDGLRAPDTGDKRLDVDREILRRHPVVPVLEGTLKTAFPVREEDLRGSRSELACSSGDAAGWIIRFHALEAIPGILWEPHGRNASESGHLYGTVPLETGRRQPVTLRLQSLGGKPVIRCVSPVGRVMEEGGTPPPDAFTGGLPCGVKISLLEIGQGDSATYDITTEGEVLLAGPAHDQARVSALILRVAEAADLLERSLKGEHTDEPLQTFHVDLKKE